METDTEGQAPPEEDLSPPPVEAPKVIDEQRITIHEDD